MPRSIDRNKRILLFAGDLLLILLSLYATVVIRFPDINIFERYLTATIFITAAYITSLYIFDLYNLSYRVQGASYIVRFLFAMILGTSFIAMTFYFLPSWKIGRGTVVYGIVPISFLTYIWRLIFRSVSSSIVKTKKNIVIVGAGATGKTIYNALNENDSFNIKGFIDDNPDIWNSRIFSHPVIGSSDLIRDMVKRNEIDTAVIAVTNEKSSELISNLLYGKVNGLDIYDMPSLYEELTGKLPILHIKDTWIVHAPFYGIRSNIYTDHIKRLFDIILSSLGLLFSLPVMLITALVIKINSKGPVLFRQKRVGLNEKVFEVLKFRSMKTDAELNGAVWAQKKDPRVTRVGKIIRTLRIDEIPQMWNVLKGEMSFVGPRPERPEFVGTLNKEIPYYPLRHSVKPGITGWAQINYRYGASKEDALEKLQYDLFYIKNLSAFLDFQILLKTIRVILMGEGAR